VCTSVYGNIVGSGWILPQIQIPTGSRMFGSDQVHQIHQMSSQIQIKMASEGAALMGAAVSH